ncbi:MAG: ATP-binding protein [Hyphomicrobiales bacterium]
MSNSKVLDDAPEHDDDVQEAGKSNDAAKPEDGSGSEQPIGEIVAISGSKASVLLCKPDASGDICPHIGTVLTMDTGAAVVLCLITAMSVPGSAVDKDQTGTRVVEVDLVGELVREEDGYLRTFRRGVSVYPKLGDTLCQASHNVLEKAYHFGNINSVEIGSIHQDPSIPAVIKVDEMLGKHFAIVGSTGSGKSCTVALLLNKVLSQHPNAHIVLLDPHNEYDACFGDSGEIIRVSSLELPFWVLNFEEIVEIIIGDAQKHADEVEVLRDLIPFAKRQYSSNRSQKAAVMLQRSVGRREKYSVDVPVPYRISDILTLIDSQMGRLENKNDLAPFKRLKARVESITQDSRYSFMFGNLTVQDNLAEILKRLFRIPVNGKPITVVQLMGLPSEIVNVVVSVLARLAFDLSLWSEGKMPITFVCEEAHRYVPRDAGVGFGPTKRAISRIAKEGRKYGVSLCVVSQRPGDVDPTILSQCSTLFTMRLSNERDQDIIRSALPDAAESLIDFLPSLGTRETIVFGEGVSMPSHIMLAELEEGTMPKGNTARFTEAWAADIDDDTFVDEVVARWRVIGQLPDDGSDEMDGEEPRVDVAETGEIGEIDEPGFTSEPAEDDDAGVRLEQVREHLYKAAQKPAAHAEGQPRKPLFASDDADPDEPEPTGVGSLDRLAQRFRKLGG